MVVIGFDGLDPRLCERLMDTGQLPNLAKMRDIGGYKPLATTIPPQSPVAWASFITGANPGVHGIFDFIHRDPARQTAPVYSAADTIESDEGWEVDGHRIPLTFWPFNHEAPRTILKRGGTPFWDRLDAAGIPAHIYDIPANYPPSRSHHGHMCCLAGMGVPDLMGTYGTYQYFSEDVFRVREEQGGIRKPLYFRDDAALAKLSGPPHSFMLDPKAAADATRIDFTVHRHPTEPATRIDIQGRTIPLREGQWSDWVRLTFTLPMPVFMPDTRVSGIARFYLKEVRPTFRLYATPIQIDPADPGDQRISEPPDFVVDIADDLGPFYTAGFQEDHKALSNGVFTDPEFHQQADYVLKERMELLDYALERYDYGLLFFYFSSTDLQAHMFWWDADTPHPVRTPAEAEKYHGVIVDLYRRMDKVVGDIIERFGDEATIIVMSDHGFGNFRRQFNLNTWLRDNGYLAPANCRSLNRAPPNPDWSRTRAYGLGLNALYLNLKGRERDGVVDPADRDALLDEISARLLAIRDPQSGQPVIARVYRREEVYTGPYAADAPDLIVGYHRGYRASWATTLGNITDDVLSDNDSAWSADHCIAAEQVPGVIFSNRPIRREHPSLVDLAPTVLDLFGVDRTAEMEGESVFESATVATR